MEKKATHKEYTAWILRKLPFIITLGVFFTILSIFWTTDRIYSRDGLSDIDVGWPIRFLSQDHSMYDPPDSWFPHGYGFLLPQEHPTSIDGLAFLGSSIINSLSVLVLLSAIYIFVPYSNSILKILKARYLFAGAGLLVASLLGFIIYTDIQSRRNYQQGIPPNLEFHLTLPDLYLPDKTP